MWRVTLRNNRAPLLSNIKLCASFHHHMSIQTGVTVQKWLNGVMTSVTLTFDLWPCHFAWTSRLSIVITQDDTMSGTLSKRCHRRTDRRTDRQTEISVLRAAWSQLKITWYILNFIEALAGSQVHEVKVKAVLNNFYYFISNPCTMYVPIKYTSSLYVQFA